MTSQSEIDSITTLFERSAGFAAERLAELLGKEKFARIVSDPKARVSITFDVTKRVVNIMVKSSVTGPEMLMPYLISVPKAD
jgi:hypothetical protein